MKIGPQLKFPEGLQREPLDSLNRLLDERSFEYLQASSEHRPWDEKHAVQLRFYAAMRLLREAVEDCTVPEAIFEIGSNFIGCEQMAILSMPRGTRNALRPEYTSSNQQEFAELHSGTGVTIRSVGLSDKQIEELRTNATGIIEDVPDGEIYVQSETMPSHPFSLSIPVTAIVPLWQSRATRGAIVFFKLLPQRDALDDRDRALLKLLAVYAGPCLFKS